MNARDRLLPEWFNRIRTGQILLPRFQRFEAWPNDKIGELLEAVLRDLPVGSALILEIGDKEKFVSRPMMGAPPPKERPTEHLLDGQQRLTALWRSFQDNYDDRTYFVFFEADPEHDGRTAVRIHGQARWRKNGVRYPQWADEPPGVRDRGYIPLKLLRPGDIGTEIQNWCDDAARGDFKASRELEQTIRNLRECVVAYNLPFLSLAASTDKDVALDVFIKLNTSSVPLTSFDILVAQIEAETGRSLHDLVSELRTRVTAIEKYIDPGDLVLDVAALREDKVPSRASYFQLDENRLVREWDRIAAGIGWTVETLREAKVFDGQRLPTVAVLAFLAALHEDVPTSLNGLGNARVSIDKYIWRAFLTRRYENSVATRTLKDLRMLRGFLRGGEPDLTDTIFDESQYPLPTIEEIKRAGWPKSRDILARGILAVTIKTGAFDFADASPVTAEHLEKREYHHLFPENLLIEDGGLNPRDGYRALNCALISWNTNRSISAKEPLKYLRERAERSSLGEKEIQYRLNSHLVPYESLAVGGYAQIADTQAKKQRIQEDYDRFLIARAELLASAIKILCEGRRWPEANV